MSKHKLTLYPTGQEILVEEGVNLLQAMKDQGIFIKSSCGGHASCGDCKVVVKEGVEFLSEQKFDELKLLGNVFHITKERLSCQTTISGDVTLDISEHQGKGSVARPQKTQLRKKNESTEKKFSSDSSEKTEKVKKQGGNRRPKPFKS